MRVVFMGTPPAAVPSLVAIHREVEVVAVYTRPDRPAGRGRRMGPSPVKAKATELGLEVVQPKSLRGEAERLEGFRPDVICVVAYGAILPPSVLSIPRKGCINVHFSLLPRWRGAAPVERALLAGDERTGVTTILMDEGLDTGPILRAHEVKIGESDTSGSLRAELADIGAELAVETIREIESIDPRPQDESRATHAPKMEPGEAELEVLHPAADLERRVRALNPKPGAFVLFRGRRLKVWRTSVAEGDGEAGRVVAVGREGVDVQTGRARLRLLEVQPEGKRRMEIGAFVAGYQPKVSEPVGGQPRPPV